MWQCIGSTCIKHVRSKDYAEVTGIVHIPERELFLSIGWNKKITAFDDTPDVCHFHLNVFEFIVSKCVC